MQRDPGRSKTRAGDCGVGLWNALLHDGDPMHARTRWACSDGFRRLLGYDGDAGVPGAARWLRRRLHPDDIEPTLRALRETCTTGVGLDVTHRLRMRDGSHRWFRCTGDVILDRTGLAGRMYGAFIDIQDAMEADVVRGQRDAAIRDGALVRRSERRLQALIGNSSDAILVVDPGPAILYRSPAAETVWGYPADAPVGRSLIGLVHPDDRPAVVEAWDRLQRPGETRTMELRLRPRGGAWRHAELAMTNLAHEPSVGGIVVTVRDVEQRKTFERQLMQHAFYDALTGLPNRLLCQERLDQALDRSRRDRSRIALLLIDLDGFKLVNDGLGHIAGDQLLIAAAARLLAVCGPNDTVARPGGDEFMVILDGLPDDAVASRFADVVTHLFEQPFTLGGRGLTITASVGVAVGEAVQYSVQMLLRNADVAMYRAKTSGKGRAMVFDASMDSDGLADLELEAELRQALERDELCVHYQPIVELGTGRLLEVEALVRWNHPSRGLLPPAHFIPLAEATGLIVPLGQRVLEQACRQAARWQAAYQLDPPLTLNVNLSPRQFQLSSLEADIATTLRRTGMDPAYLRLEITEGSIMSDVERTIPILDRLKASGVKLAIDDFGTGYSSLAYLKRLPLDVLKIDRSFVSGIERDGDDLAIIRAVISLAKSLRLSVTVEGIETAAQAAILTALSCERGQGYLFSRPVDAVAFTQIIEAASRPAPRAVLTAGVGTHRVGELEHSVQAA